MTPEEEAERVRAFDELSAEWEARLRAVGCRVCGKPVPPNNRGRIRATCSRKCRDEMQRIYSYWPDEAESYLGESPGQLAPLAVGRTYRRTPRIPLGSMSE